MTSLAAELDRPVDEAEVRGRLLRHFAERFEATLTVHEGDEAFAFLEDYLEKDNLAAWVKAGAVVS